MAGNKEKRGSYAFAWSRIEVAKKKGFYLEVVTLCESIISDRLLSYLQGVDSGCKADLRTPFAQLIKDWKKQTEGRVPGVPASDLIEDVDNWRTERNQVVHGLVKSRPGSKPVPFREFMAKAKATADTGVSLARAVYNWQRREKRLSDRIERRNAKE